MELRPIEWPRDLTPLGKMICERFQYPANPLWIGQTDEKGEISESVNWFRERVRLRIDCAAEKPDALDSAFPRPTFCCIG